VLWFFLTACYPVQFNFYDHSKVILSSHGLVVTHIDKNYKLARYTLSEIMALALQPPVTDADQAKFNQRLVDKLKYCKEVLTSIRNASANQGVEEDGGAEMGGFMSTKASKASLR
jgi:cell cycle serine/threonine-protein kinase CDC5/MSD2